MEEEKMKNEQFLEQYLSGKAPLHADRLKLPAEEELDVAEAEFDRKVATRKRPARLISFWPWVGTAVAAGVLLLIVLNIGQHQPKQQPIVAEVVEQPAPEAPKVSDYSEVSDNSKPLEPIKPIKPNRAHKPQAEPLLAQAEEELVIPPDKQALADIFLAEEALQVAYEIRAQQEAIRAYAASLTGEETPKPIIAF